MNYILLAYPRSGSSLLRVILAYATGIKPCQPQGHCEIEYIVSKYLINTNHTFKKYHYPLDCNKNIPNNKKFVK